MKWLKSVVHMHRRAHICSKYYYIFAKFTAIRQWKMIIELYSISSIFVFIFVTILVNFKAAYKGFPEAKLSFRL